MDDVDVVCYQAALGSVPRSIADPLISHNVNVNGFINILEAARMSGVNRIVYASSSSVYGDLMESPKVETRVGKLLSPYTATKMTNELYAEAYTKKLRNHIGGVEVLQCIWAQTRSQWCLCRRYSKVCECSVAQ